MLLLLNRWRHRQERTCISGNYLAGLPGWATYRQIDDFIGFSDDDIYPMMLLRAFAENLIAGNINITIFDGKCFNY